MIVPFYEPIDPLPLGPGMTVTIASSELAARPSSSAPIPDVGGGGDFVPDVSGGDVFIPPDPGSSFGVPPVGDLGLDPAEQATTTTALAPEGDDDFALDPISGGGGPPKPWGRMLILVPLCVGAGYGSVHLRRLLAARGLTPAA
jgi:hypothetical protein